MIAQSATLILAAHDAARAAQGVLQAANVCPAAPSAQVQHYSDEFLSWAKWSVISIAGIMGTGSVSMLIWGRTTHHPRGARLGFDGIMITLLGAVAYVVLPSILGGITGGAC